LAQELDLDYEELEELAELWGVEPEEVEALLQQTGYSDEVAFASYDPATDAEPEPEDEPDDAYESDDEQASELAELYGVSEQEAEALLDALDEFELDELTHGELREYIDSLWGQLDSEGWDIDVSDLWDMYYGYTQGSSAA
jgi:ABC-type taurine transport system substrate-binding protein